MSFPFTRFDSLHAYSLIVEEFELCDFEKLCKETIAPAKDQLPTGKLTEFGSKLSPPDGNGKGGRSLRWDGNVVGVWGIEPEHDDGLMSFAEAVARLDAEGLVFVAHTTARHTEQHPRWRLWLPFSKKLLPGQRRKMVDRINGLLGGIVAKESWNLSQAFFVGAQIAHRILDAGGSVRLLLREAKPSDAKKADKVAALTARGVEIVLGDVSDKASVGRATRGVVTVVSALQGGPDIIIDGQVALAKAAADNGVRRFISSDFSVDLFKLAGGSHPNLDIRRTADREIAKLSLELTNVLNGGFMEVVFAPFFQLIDLDKATVGYFGDARTALDVTTTFDTASFTALAALETVAIAGRFGVVGDVITIEQLCATLSEIHNRPFTLRRKGSIEDLEAWIKSEQTAGRAMAWPTLGAQYAWAMMSGRARIDNPVNARYPSVTTTKVVQFLKQHALRA